MFYYWLFSHKIKGRIYYLGYHIPIMGDNLIYAVSHLPRFELNIDTEKMRSCTKLKVYISTTEH